MLTFATRPLGATEAAAAADLIRCAFGTQAMATDPPSSALRETTETIAQAIANGGGAAVAEGDRLLGVVLWSERDGGLYFGRLAVRPDCRGRGIAGALIDAAEAEARRRGLDRIHLRVRLALDGNRRLFALRGYVETATDAHPGYTVQTIAVMEKRLRPPVDRDGSTRR